MHETDMERLREVPADGDPRDVARALGVALGPVRELAASVRGDFSTSEFGVAWWTGLSIQHRVLASDYLLRAVECIETNLVDAVLHQSKLRVALDEQEARFQRAAARTPPGEPPRFPAATTPGDRLPELEAQLHAAGFFRAIGSVLDVLGIAICGVVGLPVDLRRADFGKAESHLAKWTHQVQDADLLVLLERLQGLIAAGTSPRDDLKWHEFALAQRNMMVHRPRRLEHVGGRQVPLGILGSDGLPLTRLEVVFSLPKAPNLTDIESLLMFGAVPVLAEAATATVGGVREATIALSTQVAEVLLAIWDHRRNGEDPQVRVQPSKMWRAPERPGQFRGFSDQGRFRPALVRASGRDFDRLAAAGVADDVRARVWGGYDVVTGGED